MDGNKDDASRCLRIAEDAIASGDKERALKFINMAKRLNPSLSIDELIAACDNLDSISRNSSVVRSLKLWMRRSRRPRRRYNTRNDFFDDEFDPDEIFRAFFGQQRDMFRDSRAYRTRQARNQFREEEPNVAGPSCLTIIQILPFFLLLLLAYLPFSEPDYSLHKNQSYQIPKTTQNMEISFYVRSASAFDEKFPLGSSARANLEGNVIKEYRHFLFQSCRIELQKRRWNKKIPTPHCNELHDRGFVDR
ncbi:unnamed protein product [Arabidopsis arenosa]|uniref:DUF1977 domain-containing protein n=1 Tax=Arabidopsis arenosa TaxID=38785 RepID=A0A8S2AGY8_ARAAE|nr:unnamed protein product [Arabidopsis arenosa]